jgi:hypothetical protein
MTKSPWRMVGAIDELFTLSDWPPANSGTPATAIANANIPTSKTTASAAKYRPSGPKALTSSFTA